MTMTDKLVWIDLETTGLDPEVHDIVEIGIIITDRELREVVRKSWAVYAAPQEREWSREALEMHQASGLVGELVFGTSIEAAAADARRFIDRNGAGGSPMCGASVHFDRAFLRRRAMHLHEAFHYRNFDVSTLRMAAELAGLEVPEKKRGVHRALPDLDDSIALARWCVGRMDCERHEHDLTKAARDRLRNEPHLIEAGQTKYDAECWRARCQDAESRWAHLEELARNARARGTGVDLEDAMESAGKAGR